MEGIKKGSSPFIATKKREKMKNLTISERVSVTVLGTALISLVVISVYYSIIYGCIADIAV